MNFLPKECIKKQNAKMFFTLFLNIKVLEVSLPYACKTKIALCSTCFTIFYVLRVLL